MKSFRLCLAMILGLVCAIAQAAPIVDHAWIRVLPGQLPLAGYFHITNPDQDNWFLTGARSADFGSIELHQSTHKDGLARMFRLKQVAIPGKGELRFAPSGRHLMLFDRRHTLTPGEHSMIVLEFANGTELPVNFRLRSATAEE